MVFDCPRSNVYEPPRFFLFRFFCSQLIHMKLKPKALTFEESHEQNKKKNKQNKNRPRRTVNITLSKYQKVRSVCFFFLLQVKVNLSVENFHQSNSNRRKMYTFKLICTFTQTVKCMPAEPNIY